MWVLHINVMEWVKLCGLSHWGCQTRWYLLALKSTRQRNFANTFQHSVGPAFLKQQFIMTKLGNVQVIDRWTTAFPTFSNKICTNVWHRWGVVPARLLRYKKNMHVVSLAFSGTEKKNKLILIVFTAMLQEMSKLYLPKQLNSELLTPAYSHLCDFNSI